MIRSSFEEPIFPMWVSMWAGGIVFGVWAFTMGLYILCLPLTWTIHL